MRGIKGLLGSLALVSLLMVGDALAQKRGPMMTPADPAKVQEFCNEIKPLYQKGIQLKSEIRAQVWSANPNWDLVLEREIEAAKLRVEIMKKAQEKGLGPRGVYGNIRRYCGW